MRYSGSVRGIFIVIEGLDGSGGTTQTALLCDWLTQTGRWAEVFTTREPSQGPVGMFIRASLQLTGSATELGDAVLPYLFAADRRDHLDREVIPALQRCAAVVSDRYYHSSLAYQSLSVGLARVIRLNSDFRKPDLTIFLDLSPEECLERIIARGSALERFETLDRLRSISEAYESVLSHCRTSGERLIRVPAQHDRQAVHELVVGHVQAFLDELPPEPV
ncbi:MAG: dTMP kinase [Myxococcota bacterium]|jgi:dTMP kinase